MSTCANPLHDHTTITDRDGNEVASPGLPMECNDCEQPSHYDTAREWYFHNDPNAPQCFLSGPNETNPCHV